jgi:hypothetical protein
MRRYGLELERIGRVLLKIVEQRVSAGNREIFDLENSCPVHCSHTSLTPTRLKADQAHQLGKINHKVAG